MILMLDTDERMRRALSLIEQSYEICQLAPIVVKRLFLMDSDVFNRRRVEAVLLRKLLRRAYVKAILGVHNEARNKEALRHTK